MELKTLFQADDDRAVSPVIGVILMVAITVILAAVIGTFVLGLGDQVQETAPNANFDFDNSGDNLTITHTGGDSIDADELFVRGDREINSSTTFADGDGEFDFSGSMNGGDTITVEGQLNSSETIRVVWDNGDSSSVLKSYTV